MEPSVSGSGPAEFAWPLLPNPSPLGWLFVRDSRHSVEVVTGGASEECGASDARTSFDGASLCDQCADRRVARITGYPELPEPPPPATLPGPDGREHHFGIRVRRAPTGIEVELQETGVAGPDDGYHFAVLGPHDADVDALVEGVTRRATDGIEKQQLQPHPHRGGGLLRDDGVEGRLVWCGEREPGSPYDVAVDGRRLTRDEFGQALEPYEGWRFRFVLEDPCDDVRPDADVIAMSARRAQEVQPMSATAGRPTIDEALVEFLVEQEERLAARTFRNYADVIHLLRDCLNGYGYQSLDADERRRWESAYERDEEAFVHVFGPAKIADNLGEFLDYFMIRKVMAGEELLRAAGTVTKKLAKWLGVHGYLDENAVEDAVDRGAAAARDLPNAEKLSGLLYEQARKSRIDVQALDDDDYVEDYLMIDRVEPGALWFEGEIGPVKVPKAASDIAQPGWSINIVLGRTNKTWHVVEVGNVYP